MVRITSEDICKHTKIQQMAADLKLIKEEVIEKVPSHFSAKHLASAFIGALVIGFAFTLSKGLLIEIASVLTLWRIISIIGFTVLIVTSEIYFIGYSKVKNKALRPFGQFWLKRFIAYYAIAYLVSFFLVYIYGLDIVAGLETTKVVLLITMPCAVGASLADLLKQY
jgi:uncharacterized membrane protein